MNEYMEHVLDLQPADERILDYLSERPPDYIPLIASRLGLPLGYARRRFDTLEKAGLVESVTEEPVYSATDRGERCLAAAREQALATND